MRVQSSAATRSAISSVSIFRARADWFMAILRYAECGDREAPQPPDSRSQPGGGNAGDPAEDRGGQQAVTRKIAGSLRARDADRSAAGGEQIGKRPTVPLQHARL